MKSSVTKAEITLIPVSELEFDRRNPRLVGYGIQAKTPDNELIRLLWNEMAVDEVAMSIAANGYFPHEPVVVVNEGGKWVVIEGNRRLAAVRTLLDEKLRKELSPDIIAAASVINSVQELPVIKSTREESWRYLGFRHVNGPARWGSYAKATYIAQVHREYDVPLDAIAAQIGDRHRTVQRLYRALMVLKQAEDEKIYRIDQRSGKKLYFSHLYTGLGYEGFQQFLGLATEEEETESPVPTDKLGDLRQVLIWLFGDKDQGTDSIIRSQNPDLRNLDKVLGSKEACHALRQGSSLSDAVVMASPAGHRLEESLLEAKRQLGNARGLVSEAYDGSEGLLRIAGSVSDLAADLYEEMEKRKSRPSKRRRMSDD